MGRKTKPANSKKARNFKPHRSDATGSPATGPRRRGVGKSTGRKKLLAAPAPQPKPPEPGQGAKSLRSSVNSLLATQSDRMARALFDRTIAGNIPSARLLIELAGANKSDEDDSDLPTIAELLMTEPDWGDRPEPPKAKAISDEAFYRLNPTLRPKLLPPSTDDER